MHTLSSCTQGSHQLGISCLGCHERRASGPCLGRCGRRLIHVLYQVDAVVSCVFPFRRLDAHHETHTNGERREVRARKRSPRFPDDPYESAQLCSQAHSSDNIGFRLRGKSGIIIAMSKQSSGQTDRILRPEGLPTARADRLIGPEAVQGYCRHYTGHASATWPQAQLQMIDTSDEGDDHGRKERKEYVASSQWPSISVWCCRFHVQLRRTCAVKLMHKVRYVE